MASSPSIHPQHDDDHATEAAQPGKPTTRGGRVLAVATVLMAIVWVVSLIQVVRLPVQGPLHTSGEAAIWTALAIASAIATFLLGVWKVHRS